MKKEARRRKTFCDLSIIILLSLSSNASLHFTAHLIALEINGEKSGDENIKGSLSFLLFIVIGKLSYSF